MAHKISLSDFFPLDTEYFYTFPSGAHSSFLNKANAWSEELVAARPLLCAGENIKVITFAATSNPTSQELLTKLNGSLFNKKNILSLPANIDEKVAGRKRNRMVVEAIKNIATDGKLIIAQPIVDTAIKHTYQIPPARTIWFNDKKNMDRFINKKYLPKKYILFKNGRSLFSTKEKIPLPCVIKVSSSSSGDGVYLCKTKADVTAAQQNLRAIRSSIFIEQFINFKYNLGVQFGIPHTKGEAPVITGYSQQIISNKGEYLGAIIDYTKKIPAIDKIKKYLLSEVLPKVRRMGWYGVGGIDVLIDQDGDYYFIDANFRMTAATAYLFMVNNKQIKEPFLIFTGRFRGSLKEFNKKIAPLAMLSAKNQKIKIATLTCSKNSFNFNACMFFSNKKNISSNARNLLRLGVESPALGKIAQLKQYVS